MTPNQSKSFSSTDRTETSGEDAERGAFEAWATRMDVSLKRVTSRPNSSYYRFETQLAWDAWKARAAIKKATA